MRLAAIGIHFPHRQDEYLSSEKVHPMRKSAIGTSDAVDPMQISEGIWKSRCQPIGICLLYQDSMMSTFHRGKTLFVI